MSKGVVLRLADLLHVALGAAMAAAWVPSQYRSAAKV